MTIQKSLTALLLAFCLTGSLFAQGEDKETDLLTIGSVAPALDIEHWVQNGDGKFEAVTKFEEGKVYLVEFWATWCGPCIASMPHLSETQQKYADKGFQIISVSDEDLETVEEFLEKPIRGDPDVTYKQLTSTYCLTTDPDSSVNEDYMGGARQNGIPTAFIVGKTGHIEWIGHPMDKMDKAIEEVINDEWDREAFAVNFKAEQEVDMLLSSLGEKMQAGKVDEVVEDLGQAIDGSENEAVVKRLSGIRAQVMVSSGIDGAADALKAFAKISDSSGQLNQIAWAVVEMHDAGEKVSEDLICAAAEAAKKGVELEPESAEIIDTLAHLEHMQGNPEKALELMEKAVEIAGDRIPEITEYWEELKEEQAGKNDSEEKESAKDSDGDK